jgi:hypothetical protein
MYEDFPPQKKKREPFAKYSDMMVTICKHVNLKLTNSLLKLVQLIVQSIWDKITLKAVLGNEF